MIDLIVRWLWRMADRRQFDPACFATRLHWRACQVLAWFGVTGEIEEVDPWGADLTSEELGQYPFASGLWRIVDSNGRQIKADGLVVRALF